MPKKRAASSDSDSDSGPDDRTPAKKVPEKKAKSESKSSSDSGEKKFAIDKRKQVTVREFRGNLLVDIREFYEKDAELLPTKKGVSLSVTAWNKLKDLIPDIDEEISKH